MIYVAGMGAGLLVVLVPSWLGVHYGAGALVGSACAIMLVAMLLTWVGK